MAIQRAPLRTGSVSEHSGATLWVFACGHFAFWFVVDQYARRFSEGAGDEAAAVQFDFVATFNGHAELRNVSIDFDESVGDALFQGTAGT